MKKIPTQGRKCDFCSELAKYDTPMKGRTTHADMCEKHFKQYGYPNEIGYEFVEAKPEPAPLASGERKRKESEYAKSLSLEQLEEMMMDGDCEAADGCTVEPDGKCCHGYSSPLLLLGVI